MTEDATEPRLTAAEASALARPTPQAHGLPGRFYTREALDRERTALFANRWVAVAVASAIPARGDALAVDLAGWPLLLVRDGRGEVAAFFNICRHRGMRLVEGACRVGSTIRCPWHSWSFGLDGRLLATPHIDGYRIEGDALPDKAELGLKSVRCATWLDYVFVDIGGEQPALHKHLAPVAPLLAGRRTDLVHAGGWTHCYPGNWKIAVEGAIEDYHLPWGHPQLTQGVRSRRAKVQALDGCFSLTESIYDLEPSAASDEPVSPTVVAADATGVANGVLNVFPTAVLGLADDHLMLALFLPDGPDRTRVSFEYYFAPEAMEARYSAFRDRIRAGWEEVAPQDNAFVAGVNANASVRDDVGIVTRFAPAWEGAVHSFQRSVAGVYAKSGRTSAPPTGLPPATN